MRKLFLGFIAILCTFFAVGCKREVDYFEYVSENRMKIYLYKDDTCEIKIYCADEENPYLQDGYVGQRESVTEVYYSAQNVTGSVDVSLLGQSGEMSYLAVKGCYYLSFSGDADESEGVEVTITQGEKESVYTVPNVVEEAVISAKEALTYAVEYDGERFKSLTDGKNFLGEIGIRLLYDEGCYYYVGICDREGNAHAYLIDGESGRIIVERDV